MGTRISKLAFLGWPPRLGYSLHSELIRKARAFFSITGVLLGMYALSLPAEAEIEEGSGQYESTPGYYFQALSNQSIDGFLDY
jgi:hypothetical protein